MMEKKNLNIGYLPSGELENGTHDYLVKAGQKSRAMRITKNAINLAVTLYSGKEIRNAEEIGTLYIDPVNETWPIIKRATVENFEKILEARKMILNADIDIAGFILRKDF